MTEVILSLILEILSAADLVSDIIIMKAMVETAHIVWFSISIFTMLCPFLMGYGSFISLRIEDIKETLRMDYKSHDNHRLKLVLQFLYMTPFVLVYLVIMDLIYLSLTCTLLPLCLLLKIC